MVNDQITLKMMRKPIDILPQKSFAIYRVNRTLLIIRYYRVIDTSMSFDKHFFVLESQNIVNLFCVQTYEYTNIMEKLFK